MSEDVSKQIQEKLAQALKLLSEAGDLSDQNSLGELDFMGLVFEPHFGWFSHDGELQAASDWNYSECVIGSAYAAHYGMDGWKGRKFGRFSYPEGSPDTDK